MEHVLQLDYQLAKVTGGYHGRSVNYRNLAEIQARDEAKRKAEEAAGTARNPF